MADSASTTEQAAPPRVARSGVSSLDAATPLRTVDGGGRPGDAPAVLTVGLLHEAYVRASGGLHRSPFMSWASSTLRKDGRTTFDFEAEAGVIIRDKGVIDVTDFKVIE